MDSIRLGLCCQFCEAPIKFRNTTVKHSLGLQASQRLAKLGNLCRMNAEALLASLKFCSEHKIGDFRVNSQILPLKSHAAAGYDLADLPDGSRTIELFKYCGEYAKKNGLRLSMHPDQFILLSSPEKDITQRSIAELEYHGEVCEWIGADVINLHAGGAYGDKQKALERVAHNLNKLSERVRKRLTVENDDRVYSPQDLLTFCLREDIPFVYDIHHHRCLPDEISPRDVTKYALRTWNREPMFHISSPLQGWHGPNPRRHHDFIDPADFPRFWEDLDNITVEVEAKAKEKAVLALRQALLN